MAKPLSWPPARGEVRDMLKGGIDWIDVLLFLGVMVLLTETLLKTFPWMATSKPVFVASFGPLVARRIFFGVPYRGEMRTGPLWSAIGMVGLFALILGAMTAGLGLWGVSGVAVGPEPDWAAEIRTERANGISISVIPSGETPEARQAREQAQKANDEATLASDIAERHQDWLKDNARSRSVAWMITGAGLALVGLGALLDRARYQR